MVYRAAFINSCPRPRDRNPLMLLHLLNLYRETSQRSLSLNGRDFVNLKSIDRGVWKWQSVMREFQMKLVACPQGMAAEREDGCQQADHAAAHEQQFEVEVGHRPRYRKRERLKHGDSKHKQAHDSAKHSGLRAFLNPGHQYYARQPSSDSDEGEHQPRRYYI